jgi:hypothetical protein
VFLWLNISVFYFRNVWNEPDTDVGIVMNNWHESFFDTDYDVKFFPYFTKYPQVGSLIFFNLSSRKFPFTCPAHLPSSFCCQEISVADNDSACNINNIHQRDV